MVHIFISKSRKRCACLLKIKTEYHNIMPGNHYQKEETLWDNKGWLEIGGGLLSKSSSVSAQ